MIHPNVCFLILLICCWVVTASLMAEKTNVGVAVFVADNTYGCGSDGAAALLSACSLVRCCSHQFGFPCLEVLLQGTPPPCTISCKTLPGHSVDADSLHISCADIFISQVRAASGSPPQYQLTVEDVFWDATILHTTNMTQPTQSALSEQGVHSGKTGTRQDISVGYLSCQDMPRIRRMLLRWNELSLLSCPAYVVHVSLPYSNVLITQAL